MSPNLPRYTPWVLDFGPEGAFPSIPDEIFGSVETLFPAFWCLFFTFKQQRHITDHTAYAYAKDVVFWKKDPPEWFSPEMLDAARSAYSAMVDYFERELLDLANPNAQREKLRQNARSQVHAILVDTYEQYRHLESMRRKPAEQPPDVHVWISPEVALLRRVWVIEVYDTRRVIIATYHGFRKTMKSFGESRK